MAQPVGWIEHPASSDVDAERGLAEERARALGRAGRGLERALASYREALVAGPLTAAEERAHIDAIASRLYGLVVQRECAGARHDNLEKICAVYDIPEAALRRL